MATENKKRRVIYSGASKLGVPQFPGNRQGMTKEEAQAFTRNMVRRTGFRFSGGASPKSFNLDIPGDADFLYGIAFLNDSFGVCELKINNETVIESTDTGFMQFGLTEQDYFAVNRLLTGTDKVTLVITGDAGYNNEPFVVYYK